MQRRGRIDPRRKACEDSIRAFHQLNYITQHMPPVVLPRDLRPVVSRLQKEQKQFIASAEGQRAVRLVAEFSRSSRQFKAPEVLSERGAASAKTTLNWFTRLPGALVRHATAPLVDLRGIQESDAVLAVSDGLQVIAAGACALLAGTRTPEDFAPDAILHAAFGLDSAAVAIRKPLADPRFPWPKQPADVSLPKIDELVRAGTVR